MRLTKDVIQRVLDQNDGYKKTTYSDHSKNAYEYRHYLVEGGKLLIRMTGKGSWSDSRYDQTVEADPDQTRYFIRKYGDGLDTDGVI